MKNIITSIITTLIIIGIFMITMANVTPKEPKLAEKINVNQLNSPITSGIVIDDQSQSSNISTSAVVGIAVERMYGNKLTQKLGNDWSVGSGFIVDSDGYIVTNQHVIGNTDSEVYVTLYGGDTVKGEIVWANQEIDLAIVKIKVAGLPYMKLADSKKITIGETVYAIGNPLGYEFQRTVTSGIVSGINRSINVNGTYMEDLIQTDASINSGNSGGPLINKKGEVIGINTIKVEAAEGIGFAIPINQIKPIIEKIKTTGEFKELYLGIHGYDKEMISNMNSSIRINKGIYVYDIDRGSPAEKAGIEKSDIIITVQKEEVNSICELREQIFKRNIDETIEIGILRNNIPISIYAKLTEKDNN